MEIKLAINHATGVLLFVFKDSPIDFEFVINEVWLVPVHREAEQHCLVLYKNIFDSFILNELILVSLLIRYIINDFFLELVVVFRQLWSKPILKQIASISYWVQIDTVLIHTATLARTVKDDSLCSSSVVLLPNPLQRNANFLFGTLNQRAY